MKYGQIELDEACIGQANEDINTIAASLDQQCPMWLSAAEAEILLSMCSLSPVSAGDLEEILFHKMGMLINSFEMPHPKAI